MKQSEKERTQERLTHVWESLDPIHLQSIDLQATSRPPLQEYHSQDGPESDGSESDAPSFLETDLLEVETATPSQGAPPQTPEAALSTLLSHLPRLDITTQGAAQGHIRSNPTTEHTPAQEPEFQLLSVLGEGGMGRVQAAYQRSLGREVALKFVKREVRSPQTMAALLEEARITGALEHPNIIPVHILGCDATGQPIIVMKRVEGIPWRTLIHDPVHPAWTSWKSLSKEPLLQHLDIFKEVCLTVHFAHSRGILHRDIKPDNIMIGEFGEVYLLDWGIAVTRDAEAKAFDITNQDSPTPPTKNKLIGTPAYMAPEMLYGDAMALDERTDVYLLGATLYEVLLQQAPHKGCQLQELLYQVLASELVINEPHIPAELAAIVAQATQLSPDQRYPDAIALRDAIDTFLLHRDSNELCHVALLQSNTLRETITKSTQTNEIEIHNSIHRIFTEARFGFKMALQRWADNDKAIRADQHCIELMLAYAIQQRDLKLAHTLQAESVEVKEELHSQLRALEASLQQEEHEKEALQHMRDDLDIHHSHRQKILLMAGMVAFWITAMLWAYFTGSLHIENRTHGKSIAYLVFAIVALFAGLAASRKSVLKNTASRRLFTALSGFFLLLLVHRLVGWRLQWDITQVLHQDLFMLTATMVCFACFVDPLVWYSAGFCLFASLLVAWKPEWIVLIYNAVTFLCWASAAFYWWYQQDVPNDRNNPPANQSIP